MAKVKAVTAEKVNREGDTLFKMFDYFCSRINFSKSFLDADGVACMNRLFLELKKDTRIIKVD